MTAAVKDREQMNQAQTNLEQMNRERTNRVRKLQDPAMTESLVMMEMLETMVQEVKIRTARRPRRAETGQESSSRQRCSSFQELWQPAQP